MSEMDVALEGKTGTPVQSIDSAVESLEDSPLERQHRAHQPHLQTQHERLGEELSVELERRLGTGGAGSDHGAGDSGIGSSEPPACDSHHPACSCHCQASPHPPTPDEIAQRNWFLPSTPPRHISPILTRRGLEG